MIYGTRTLFSVLTQPCKWMELETQDVNVKMKLARPQGHQDLNITTKTHLLIITLTNPMSPTSHPTTSPQPSPQQTAFKKPQTLLDLPASLPTIPTNDQSSQPQPEPAQTSIEDLPFINTNTNIILVLSPLLHLPEIVRKTETDSVPRQHKKLFGERIQRHWIR